MTKNFNPRKERGIVAVRADGSNPTAILAELSRAFEEFKAEHTKEMEDLRKNRGDVVQSEKVDRINSDITALQAALDETNQMLAAVRSGGAGGSDTSVEALAHANAFNSWFRRGDRGLADADLGDLQVQAGLTTDSNEDGGWFVPEQTSNEVDRVVGTISAMREISQVMTISAPTYKKLINLGGAASGWVGEKDERPETDTPTLTQIVFNLQELYANPAATQTTLDDARLDIAQWLANEVAEEFAEQEGDAFVNGNGKNKPRGILSYDTVANSSHKWGKVGCVKSGAAASFSSTAPADALISLYYALKQKYRNGASWLMSDATMEAVRKFKNADGDYIWAPPSASAELATILRKPVRTDDNMDKIAAGKCPIAFSNFKRSYLIVDGFGVRVLRDPFTNKPYVHFYTTKRVGGGLQNFEAIKLLKIGN